MFWYNALNSTISQLLKSKILTIFDIPVKNNILFYKINKYYYIFIYSNFFI